MSGPHPLKEVPPYPTLSGKNIVENDEYFNEVTKFSPTKFFSGHFLPSCGKFFGEEIDEILHENLHEILYDGKFIVQIIGTAK